MIDGGDGRLTMAMALPRVLVFSANQVSNSLDVDGELRAIRRALEGVATVDHLPAARAEELVSDLSTQPPVVMHFMGHGSPVGLELAYGRDDYRPADGQALRDVLAGRGIELVVLSSCYSAAQANQIAQSVKAVVGTPDVLEDESSAMFSGAFYKALRRHATVGQALRDGQDAVRLQHASDQFEIVGEEGWRLPAEAPIRATPSVAGSRRPWKSRLLVGAAGLVALALVIGGLRLLGGDSAVEATEGDLGSESLTAGSGAADDTPTAGSSAPDTDDTTSPAGGADATTDTTDPTTTTATSASTTSSTDGASAALVPLAIDPDFPDCLTGVIKPTGAPSGGEVEPGKDGCPVLSNRIATPFRTDQWTIDLTENQTLSYVLSSNVYWTAVTITAPDNTILTNVTEDPDFNGQLTAPTTGTYTITLENPNYTSTSYTIKLYDIS